MIRSTWCWKGHCHYWTIGKLPRRQLFFLHVDTQTQLMASENLSPLAYIYIHIHIRLTYHPAFVLANTHTHTTTFPSLVSVHGGIVAAEPAVFLTSRGTVEFRRYRHVAGRVFSCHGTTSWGCHRDWSIQNGGWMGIEWWEHMINCDIHIIWQYFLLPYRRIILWFNYDNIWQ